MTIEERLAGICEWITVERESECDDSSTRWIASGTQAKLSTAVMRVTVEWPGRGPIVVDLARIDGGYMPGDVCHMEVIAAANSAGDLAVAETINDQIA